MNIIFTEFIHQMMTSAIDFSADTFKVALFGETFTPDPVNHKTFADIASLEVTGEGYIAGGATLTNVNIVRQDEGKNTKLVADDVTWPNATLAATGAVIYKDVVDHPETSPLLLYIDFGSEKSSLAGNFTIQWAENGILTLSQNV